MTNLTKNSTTESKPLPKIIVTKKEPADSGWNKHLPIPLINGEKVIVTDNQNGVAEGYIRIRHGKGEKKAESVFSRHHFITLSGKEFAKC